MINSELYSILIDKVNPLKLRGYKIDLLDIFKDLDISADIKENITFAMVNKSAIEEHDVTLSELLTVDDKKSKLELKPEPPKNPNPNPKHRGFVVKNQKRSFDLDKIDNEPNIFASIDYQSEIEYHRQSPIPKYRITSVKEKNINRKSHLIEKNDKHIRVRSVTPVYVFKDKLSTASINKAKQSRKIDSFK